MTCRRSGGTHGRWYVQEITRSSKFTISGRRNCLGGIIGERSAEDMLYISGALKAFAVAVNSNAHTGPDYRLPPCAATHDASCKVPACLDALNSDSGQEKRQALVRLCKAAQRAARQTAGYFFGYTFKGQPVGKKSIAINLAVLRLPEQIFGGAA